MSSALAYETSLGSCRRPLPTRRCTAIDQYNINSSPPATTTATRNYKPPPPDSQQNFKSALFLRHSIYPPTILALCPLSSVRCPLRPALQNFTQWPNLRMSNSIGTGSPVVAAHSRRCPFLGGDRQPLPKYILKLTSTQDDRSIFFGGAHGHLPYREQRRRPR